VAFQFADEVQAEDRLARGMVQDVNFDEAEEEFAEHISPLVIVCLYYIAEASDLQKRARARLTRPTRNARIAVMKFFAAISLLSVLVACGTAPAPTLPISSTWLPFQRGLPTQATVLALAVDPRDPARIIAGTYDTSSAYIMADGGRSWRVLNTGLVRAPILAMLSAGDSLLAGTTAGLYRLVDQTWARIVSSREQTF
jgi:hypothetical protein